MRYARIEDGKVAEIVIVPPGYAVEDMFAEALVSAMVPCDAIVQPGWTAREDGSFVGPDARETKPRRARKKTGDA